MERKTLTGRDALLIETLTRKGELDEGEIGDPAALASWMDYVNHDGTTGEEIERDLRRLAAEGWISLEAGKFRLIRQPDQTSNSVCDAGGRPLPR